MKERGNSFNGFIWKLQKNIVHYRYCKVFEKQSRIPYKQFGRNNIFIVAVKCPNKINRVKTSNTLLSTLLHSTDAYINVEFALAFQKKFGYQVQRVHDSFGIPFHLYREACDLYKDILFEKVFKQDISGVLPLPSDASETLQTRYKVLSKKISDKKCVNIWQAYKTTYNGYPLYPK